MSAKGPELEIGATIPGTKYQVVRELGAGGMGVVYQVVKPPNIQGVLKLMSTELTRHEEHRLRFFDEVRILAQLDHPNIVKVFDYDALPDGAPFYVMELLTGRTVRDVICTMGSVQPHIAYEITRQLLEALQAAHTNDVPVIHRDIKPENIFLHAPRHGEPVVKLIDFGVSAVADREHDGAFVGTWSYAAPEQIRGDIPTPASDLYAVGLVLYELLAGVGPFDHYDDWTKISKAQLEEIPAPVSKFAPWVPPSIVALIQSALAKDPRVRPRDARAFADRLFELGSASDGEARRSPRFGAPVGARPAYAIGAVAAAGAAIARAAAAARAGLGPVEVGGTGPLSKVLTAVTSTPHASHETMAAATQAADRPGDVPLLGVAPESAHAGPTWRGLGGRDLTSPGADELLAGLDAVGVDAITAPRTFPHTPAHATAETLDEVPAIAPGPSPRDTFSSQSSDARRARPRSRTGVFVLAGALVLMGFVTATIVIVRGSSRDASPSIAAKPLATPPPTAETAPAPIIPSAAPTTAASAAEPTTPPESDVVRAAATAGRAAKTTGAPATGTKAKRAPATAAPAAAAPTGSSATPVSSSTDDRAPSTPNTSDDFIRHF